MGLKMPQVNGMINFMLFLQIKIDKFKIMNPFHECFLFRWRKSGWYKT